MMTITKEEKLSKVLQVYMLSSNKQMGNSKLSLHSWGAPFSSSFYFFSVSLKYFSLKNTGELT